MKAKAVRVYSRTDLPNEAGERWDPQRHAKLANHMAHCSRACCGNPRRNGWDSVETMQERRAFQCEEWPGNEVDE